MTSGPTEWIARPTKGFLFAVGGTSDVRSIIQGGLFGVWQPSPAREKLNKECDEDCWPAKPWTKAQAATFADYQLPTPGDLVFFFKERVIYGIGEVAKHGLNSDRLCPAVWNYPTANEPIPSTPPNKGQALYTEGNHWQHVRVVLPFVPSPVFFKDGIDMDEALSSRGAEDAWGLRFWENKSFQHLGWRETQLLVEAFVRRFVGEDGAISSDKMLEMATPHPVDRIRRRYHGYPSARSIFRADSESYVEELRHEGRGSSVLKMEEWLHAALGEWLVEGESDDETLLRPDHTLVFHEVPTSPPKPPRWADRVDLLGVRTFDTGRGRVPSRFVVVEAKVGWFPMHRSDPFNQPVTQVMRYVDYVAREFAGGNYDAVQAYIVASGFWRGFVDAFESAKGGDPGAEELTAAITRSYVLDPRERPIATRIWDKVSLVKYEWDVATERLILSRFPTG